MPLLKDFSIQLYSIRDIINDDYDGTVRELASIGFKGVEFAGDFGGHSATELKRLLDGCGLKTVSAHVGLDLLIGSLDERIDFFGTLGAEYIILPHAEMNSRDEVLALAKELGPIARKIRQAGMKFGYHNHAHEFKKDGGEFMLDIFYENTDPAEVVAQLDVAWVAVGGADVVAYMQKWGSRVELLHIKQIESLDSGKQVDLADGVLDFKEIILAGQALGVKQYIMEQEEYPIDPMTSVRNGFAHIMGL